MAASGIEVHDYEFDIIYNEGTKRHLLGDAIPLRDNHGEPSGAIATFIDITERKIAEEKLRENEEKFRNIVETANEGISTIDYRGTITYANQKLLDMLGYSVEEFVNKPSLVFVENVTDFKAKLEERQKGISDSRELKVICKDGSKLWVHASVKSLFNEKDEYIGSLGMFTDISKRKLSELALLESEARYRALAENSPDIIIRFDRKYRHIYANPAAVRSYGISLDEIIGKTQGELGRDIRKVITWEKHLENTFVTGTSETMEYHIILNGKKHYFNTKMAPEFAYGKVFSVLAISRDITNIKEAEFNLKVTLDNLENLVIERTAKLEKAYNVLKESEKDFADAQKTAHIGNWKLDLASGATFWSDELFHIFDMNPQTYGLPLKKVLDFTHPDDRDYVYNAVQKAFKGEAFDIEFKIVLTTGNERILHTRTEVIFDEKNSPFSIKGIVQDITERKKAEERLRESEGKYRNIVETANEGIVKTDEESVISYVNHKMADMLGYASDEVIGRSIWGFIADEYKQIIKMNLEKKKQGISESGELKLICKDGSHIWTYMNSKPLFEKDGKYTGAVSMLTDITKRKEAEDALANIEIARKKEIHHRIKNNLQVISSLLDLQADKFRNKKSIRDSEVLEAFKESQDRVISMALIHEELYRGGGFEKLNFSPYVEELSGNLLKTYQLGNRNISLKLSLDTNVFFDMDIAVPLGMIINELVSNSFKHAFVGRDEGEIQIKLHREEIRVLF